MKSGKQIAQSSFLFLVVPQFFSLFLGLYIVPCQEVICLILLTDRPHQRCLFFLLQDFQGRATQGYSQRILNNCRTVVELVNLRQKLVLVNMLLKAFLRCQSCGPLLTPESPHHNWTYNYRHGPRWQTTWQMPDRPHFWSLGLLALSESSGTSAWHLSVEHPLPNK